MRTLIALAFFLFSFSRISWCGEVAQTDLFGAIRDNNPAILEELVSHGHSLEAPDVKGTPPLVFAAELGFEGIVFKMLSLGAAPDAVDRKERTALMVAARNGNVSLVIILLEAGANPYSSDMKGNNCFDYAMSGKAPEQILATLNEYDVSIQQGKSRDFSTDEYREKTKPKPVRVFFATNRTKKQNQNSNKIQYSDELDKTTHYGMCDVTIPPSHQSGELETSMLDLEFTADDYKHVVLHDITEISQKDFFKTFKSTASEKDILIFIHGYNVSFNKAARRTAQLAYDLQFPGIPLFFSWPSKANIFKYKTDAENVRLSIPALTEFIAEVVKQFKPERIHVIAHSMGTYGFTQALLQLKESMSAKHTSPLFNQIVLAAPDIDASTFQKDIAPNIKKLASRVSLYASSKDAAMTVSRNYNNGRRAGDSVPEIITSEGIDSIDVSRVDTSFVGHSYYGSNNSIISDIRLVLSKKKPEERKFLDLKNIGTSKRKYWFFNPAKYGG